jgi:hypothetical protein
MRQFIRNVDGYDTLGDWSVVYGEPAALFRALPTSLFVFFTQTSLQIARRKTLPLGTGVKS